MSDQPKIIKAPSGHISSRDASRRYKVTNDYVARLCRKGKLQGVLVGREWFVDEASLASCFGNQGATTSTPVVPNGYISSDIASERFQLSQSYLSRLSRRGEVDA